MSGSREHECTRLDEAREGKIAALEGLVPTRAELDSERQLRATEANEGRMAAAQRDDALRGHEQKLNK